MLVGIEIAPNLLRGVRCERARVGRPPEQVEEVPWTPTHPADVPSAEALSLLAGRLNAGRVRLAVAVPSSWCFYRTAAFPYRSARRVETTLAYALEGRLPGRIEDYIIEPLSDVIPAGAKGSRIQVVAFPVRRMRDLLGAFHSANLDPCIVQPAPAALAAALHAAAANRLPTLVVRACGAAVEVAFTRNSHVLGFEHLPVTVEDNRATADATAIARHIAAAIRAHELCAGLSEYRRVVLLAADEVRPALCEEIERHLEIRPELWPDSLPGERWATAWGVALQAQSSPQASINLRQGELAFRPHQESVARRLTASAALATAMMILLIVFTARKISSVREGTRLDRAEQAKLFAEVTGARTAPSLAAMEAALANALKEAARAERKRTVSSLQRWVELVKLLPSGSEITFDALDINQQRISIAARTPDAAQVWEFRKRIEASAYFLPDAPVVTRNPGTGETSFTMELRYR